MYNLTAELAQNLQSYSDFIKTSSAIPTPAKIDVPKVWDMYMDTTPPLGAPLAAVEQPPFMQVPIGYQPLEFEGESVTGVTYASPITGDLDMLGLVNDRLKTQARRYPHPISNDMEVLG